ncbi:hypothetical protein BT93_G0342 [Corymbia citriodora subsp. variegata]|nr:hypothetical protein BT93_G0342 [Corymbia citriodora subsp. variegata]
MAAAISWKGFLLWQIMLLLQQAIDGFGFRPTDAELIKYLMSKEPGYRGGLCIIPTLTNFNDFNPRDSLANFKGKSIIPSNDRECWYIIPQKQNIRVCRKTPSGSSWKVTGKETPIKIAGDSTIGFKKILSFPDDRGSKIGKSNYIIHEYRLPDKDSNYVLCHLMLKQDERADNSTTRSEHGAIDQHVIQAMMEPPRQSTQHQNQVRLSLPYLLQLLRREPRSQINSFCSPIHQSKNIESLSGKDFRLDNSLTDKSIELKSSLETTKEDVGVDAMPNADLSYAEVQTGEEPRFRQVQQETAAGNIDPCRSLDEAAAREKNGQISITENRRSITESLDRVASTEETDGILWSTFSGPEFSDFSDFEEYFDEPAAQAKGQEQEEHDLDGNSPKRRRLDGDLHWCEGRKPDVAAGSWTPESLTQIALTLQEAVEGFGFSPTEEQLIDYLKTEQPGHRRGESIIPSNDREWWFISPQKQNKRVRRKTPSGSWKVTSKRMDIKIAGNPKPIGFKKILSFPDGRGSKIGKSNWVIHEYHLPDKDVLNLTLICSSQLIRFTRRMNFDGILYDKYSYNYLQRNTRFKVSNSPKQEKKHFCAQFLLQKIGILYICRE